MIGLDILNDVEGFIYKLPYPVLLGVVIASLVASLPWVFMALGHWISDLGRYGPIFPFFWIASGVILLLTRTVDNANISEHCSGWMEYLILFGVITCMSLILYLAFFLVFCFLEVVSRHFKWFVYTWIITFLLVALFVSCWMYFRSGSGLPGFVPQKTSSCSENAAVPEETTGWSWFGRSSDKASGGGSGTSAILKCPKTPAKF